MYNITDQLEMRIEDADADHGHEKKEQTRQRNREQQQRRKRGKGTMKPGKWSRRWRCDGVCLGVDRGCLGRGTSEASFRLRKSDEVALAIC